MDNNKIVIINKNKDGIGEICLIATVGDLLTETANSDIVSEIIIELMIPESMAAIGLVRINFNKLIFPFVSAEICKTIQMPPKENIPVIKGIYLKQYFGNEERLLISSIDFTNTSEVLLSIAVNSDKFLAKNKIIPILLIMAMKIEKNTIIMHT